MSFIPLLAFEASAGSGKTFNLVVRYLSLVFMGEKVESISALTFTNKAANEMRERVIETLTTLEKRGELGEIARVSGLSEATLLAKRDEVLATLLRSEMKISTIDTFFGGILRRFALNQGMMPTFSVANAHHEVKFLKRFLADVKQNGEMDALVHLATLSSKSLKDIFGLLASLYAKHTEFPSLLPPNSPMLTDQTASIMASAQALAALVLSKPLSDRAKKTMLFESYEELLTKAWITKPSLNYWDFRKNYDPVMDTMLQSLQSAIADQMNYRESRILGALDRILTLYAHSRKALILQNNELTFDDITLNVHELLQGNLESAFLYFRLDARMKHLLLDEFQDTSTVQFDIFRPLIHEIVSNASIQEGGSFFFVGDVKQSIYRFRGGVSALFHAVAHEFNVTIQALKVNYRSRTEVVNFVNTIFTPIMPHYTPQASPEHKKGGYVQVIHHEEPLVVLRDTVTALLDEGVIPERIAILCVTNADATQAQMVLEEQGHKVVSEATSALIHQRSVRIVIEYLRYCYFNVPLYRHNCAALLGIEAKAIERTSTHDLSSTCVAFVQYHAIGDSSALLFLEELERYKDIEALIFEIDRLETPAPKEEQKGLSLMTIHKSKGLEFDHVLVLDRLGMMKSRNDFMVYAYEGIALERIFIRTKGREALDDRYALALAKEETLQNNDQLNALYVALTRAVESLTLIAKPKGSWFEPLGLSVGAWGKRSFKETSTNPILPLQPLSVLPHSYGKQHHNIPTLDGGDAEAITYGLALHYGMEMMESFHPIALRPALQAIQKRYGLSLGEEKITRLERTLFAILHDATFIHLTQGSCVKEQAFWYREQKWVIDLLIDHDEGYWVIIDYKSGEEKSPQHAQQVQNYMAMIHHFTQKKVRGYLCYAKIQGCEWERC